MLIEMRQSFVSRMSSNQRDGHRSKYIVNMYYHTNYIESSSGLNLGIQVIGRKCGHLEEAPDSVLVFIFVTQS